MSRQRTNFAGHQAGLTLIELMVALVIGLLVVGSAFGIFMANRRTYGANQSISRIQENARIAFELMSRDIREAGGSPCDTSFPVANVLGGGTAWWNNINAGLVGIPAAAPITSDSLRLVSATTSVAVIDAQTGALSKTLHVNATSPLASGDVLMACDFQCGTIFQMTGPATLSGSGLLNTNQALACSSDPSNAAPQKYREGGEVARLQAVEWSVASNSHGGNSLYRRSYVAGVAQAANEVADGVQSMTLRYLMKGQSAYVDAASVTDWSTVTAVQVQLQLQGTNEKAGTNNQVLTRIMNQTVAVRPRDNLQETP